MLTVAAGWVSLLPPPFRSFHSTHVKRFPSVRVGSDAVIPSNVRRVMQICRPVGLQASGGVVPISPARAVAPGPSAAMTTPRIRPAKLRRTRVLMSLL